VRRIGRKEPMFTIVNLEDTQTVHCYTYSYAKAFQLALLISDATGVPLAILRRDEMIWNSKDGETNAA
jgi:adenine/guanine phosphoribosyltransferase-like PRPP-binding protein